MTIQNKPTIYNAPTIYKTGAEGGGGGDYEEIAGRAYKVTTIGGVTWMAENLDFIPESGVQINPDSAPGVAAVFWKDSLWRQKYGLFYNWYAASYLESNKSVLIPGWHLPTKSECENLISAVGGSSVAGLKLKSVDGWDTYGGHSGGGSGVYDFNALPAGYRDASKYYGDENRGARIWSMTESGSYFAYFLHLQYDKNGANMSTLTSTYGQSIRLVKD